MVGDAMEEKNFCVNLSDFPDEGGAPIVKEY